MLHIKIDTRAEYLNESHRLAIKNIIIMGGKIHYDYIDVERERIEVLATFSWWEPKFLRRYIKVKLHNQLIRARDIIVIKATTLLI